MKLASLKHGRDGRLLVRCLVLDRAQRDVLLQALYAVPETLSELSANVQDAYETYRTRAYMRSQIKFSFALSLSLVLLLGLFAAAWAAVSTAVCRSSEVAVETATSRSSSLGGVWYHCGILSLAK